MTKKILVLYPRANDYANIPRLSLPYEFVFEKFSLDMIALRGYSHSEPIEEYSREQMTQYCNMQAITMRLYHQMITREALWLPSMLKNGDLLSLP